MHQYDADYKFFVVLRPGKVHVQGLRHKPDLAPSAELFQWAQEHKHESNWFDAYSKQFCYDMQHRPGLRDAVKQLEALAAEHSVLLVCFCPDPLTCHRSLIATELQRRGVEVELH
ncbi:MAG: DUF488 domain-containing protein [Methanocorpusculum sp.]|nr:DUF488 domain-containing protein [Oscillospiraceae bacterium]MBQ3570638.1 DUF488 domain-containing protein [Methanocorpusculum sp.]